jgi:hypothetical protein
MGAAARKRILLLVLFAGGLPGCAETAFCGDSPDKCKSALFIGNSYTYANDLPKMVLELARSGGYFLETGMAAQGGWSLADHAADDGTGGILGSRQWDYVVLQEQSRIPTLEESRLRDMYPAVDELAQRIRADSGVPILFETWGYRDGLPDYGIADYETMQYRILEGYEKLALSRQLVLAPVGLAWWRVRLQQPGIDLWQADGSHPGRSGTYLAACVFYAVFFGVSPEGLAYTAQLPAETAAVLQKAAGQAVLG